MAEIELPEPKELEEKKAEPFTKRVALTTAIFAVVLAITSLGGSNAMKEMLLAQQQASDQWAFYQAKVIREHLYRAQAEQARVALLTQGKSVSPEGRKALEDIQAAFEAEAARYAKEKQEIEPEAKRFEAQRDLAAARDQSFDYAGVLFQIAIVLGSVAILSASRTVLVMGPAWSRDEAKATMPKREQRP